MRTLIVRLLLSVACAVLLGVPASAGAADPESVPLETRCVAAAMSSPVVFRAGIYNRHPQSKTESLVQGDVSGTARRLPAFCIDSYRRFGYAKVQFKSTTSKGKWIAVKQAWRSLDFGYGDQSGRREYFPFLNDQNLTAAKQQRNLGCLTEARSSLKLELQDAKTGTVIAARYVQLPAEVDSLRSARCQGKLSIRDQTKHCPQKALGVTTTSPRFWNIQSKATSCGTAVQVGQRALMGYSSDGDLDPRRVSGWKCFYSQNASVACLHGRARIYLQTNRGRRQVGDHCSAPEVIELIAANASCSLAQRLSAQADPPSANPSRKIVSGQAWRCFARRLTPVIRYQCFSRVRVVTFLRHDPAAEEPYPTTIPEGTIYPGGGTAAIARTPILRFGESFIRDGQVVIELETEEGLAGRPAQLQVARWHWHCGVENSCQRERQAGKAQIRTFPLETKQLLTVGPVVQRGNWSYEIEVTSAGFAVGDVRYGPAEARQTYLMLYG